MPAPADSTDVPTLLLVEDDPGHADLVLHSLARHPESFRTVHVSDGEAALDYLFDRGPAGAIPCAPRPAAVLLDLHLPKMDGFEVLAEIRACRALDATPVVILSSSDEKRDIERAYAARANSYLVKPIGYDRLHETLKLLVAYWFTLNRTV